MRIGEACSSVVLGLTGEASGVLVDSDGLDLETASDARLMRRLATYHHAVLEHVKDFQDCLSIICDKSRIFDKGIMSCVVALPDGVAFWKVTAAIKGPRSLSTAMRHPWGGGCGSEAPGPEIMSYADLRQDASPG